MSHSNNSTIPFQNQFEPLPYLSVLELDAHGMGLVLEVLDLRTDAAQVILKLAQHLFHTLRKQKLGHLSLIQQSPL